MSTVQIDFLHSNNIVVIQLFAQIAALLHRFARHWPTSEVIPLISALFMFGIQFMHYVCN